MELLIRWSWTFGLAGLLLLGGATVVGYFNAWDFSGRPTGLAVAGSIGLILYAVLDRERVGDAIQSRAFVYGSGSTVMVILAAAVAMAAFTLARRNDTTFDWTRSQQHTLSDHTIGVLEALQADVTVTAYVPRTSPQQKEIADLTRRMEIASDRVVVTFVDPLSNPRAADEADITGDHGTVIVAAGDRDRRLEWPLREEDLVSAVVMVTSGATHRVCWALGHGEPDPDDEFTEPGLGLVRLELERFNYQVTAQRVPTQGIDQGCAALVVARPTVEWSVPAREALAAYLAGGGRALMLLEPETVPELAAELERYGVRVGDDLIFDTNLKNQLLGVDDPTVVVLSETDFVEHPITRSLGAAVVLPGARSVGTVRDRDGVTVRELVRTSPAAWAETDLESAEVGPDEGIDLIGEIPVMVSVDIDDPAVIEVADPEGPDEGASGVPADFSPASGGRLVVVGDSDFANNATMMFGNNRDVFLNAMAWLVDEEAQLGERPDQGDTLEITAFGEAMMCLVSVVLVPGLAALLAFGTLVRRRYL